MFNSLADMVSGAWWSYLLVVGLAFADVFFPLVPSETAVLTGGVLASSGDMQLSLVIIAAATGAILGDNTAYLLGRYFERPIRRWVFRGAKAKERLEWSERQVTERGGELIAIGRFIPGGRTAVTLACGTLHMRWRRFIVFDAAACLFWASYAALLGYFGGKTFENEPWKGLLLALGIAFAIAGCSEGVR